MPWLSHLGKDRNGTEIGRQSGDCITGTNNASDTKMDRLYFVSVFLAIQRQHFCMNMRSGYTVVAFGAGIRKLQ